MPGSTLEIIVVQKNDYKHLELTLKSISEFARSFSDVSVIVKSWGDSDFEAEKICRQFSDLTLVHIQSRDTGIYDAMNQAVSYATGKYIMFLNAGDVFALPHISLQPLCDQHVKVFKYLVRVERGLIRRERGSRRYFLRRMLNHQGLVYRSDVLKENRFNTQNIVTGDLRHILEHGLYKEVAYVDEILVEYCGGGFASLKSSVEMNWNERSAAYKWTNVDFATRWLISIVATIRKFLRKWI